jgi:FkbM family methyltransferase
LKDGNGFGALKLNIGSGDAITMKGYVNVDAKFGDMAFPLQYGDNTVDECRASHILEHFPQGQILDVLRDWTRVLKPGGVLKVAVPDLEVIAGEYVAGNPQGLPLAGYLMGGQTDDHDYHRAVFDHTALSKLLFDAGLRDIGPWKSEVKDCASLPVSLNLMGRKPEGCPKCGNADGRLLEGMCYHCHPAREQIQAEWDDRTSRFLADAHGLIRFGANDGAQREVYARYGLPVIWVEALPDVCARLVENVAGYPNHRALNYLLTNVDGEEYDYGVASNAGKSSSIFAFADHKKLWPKIDYTHSIKLKSTTFKTMVEREGVDIAAYDALIMDIQGSELKALQGMGDLVDGFKWILAEAADFEMYEGGCRLQELDDYLIPRGFVRVELFTAMGMRGVGQVYDALYKRKQAASVLDLRGGALSDEIRVSNGQYPTVQNFSNKVFAAGQWREVGHKPGQVQLETVQVAPIAIATSTPRYGSLLASDTMWQVAVALKAVPGRAGGAWWEQGLTRQIEKFLELETERGKVEFIITVDFDSYMTPEDGLKLIRLMYENPQIDCIVPMQVRRGTFQEILAQTDGAVNLNDPLVSIVHGHFGFTVFRRRVFDRISTPWFLNIPDEDGRWQEGRRDADIYFWNKFCDEGFKAAMSTEVVIGHGDEMVSWPQINPDGSVTKINQSVFEWVQTHKPPQGILRTEGK